MVRGKETDRSVRLAAGLLSLSSVPLTVCGLASYLGLLVMPLVINERWSFTSGLIFYAILFVIMTSCYYLSSTMLMLSELMKNNLLLQPRRVKSKLIMLDTVSSYLVGTSVIMLLGSFIGYIGLLVREINVSSIDLYFFLGSIFLCGLVMLLLNRYVIVPMRVSEMTREF